MAKKKRDDAELEILAEQQAIEDVGAKLASFVACPPPRSYETADRARARESCEKRAKSARLSVARMLDTRPSVFKPEGFRYTSGSVIASTKGALSAAERRSYGCIETGYSDRERRAFGCAVDEQGRFTGALEKGGRDRRCKEDRRFSGQRRVGKHLVSDQICGAGFKPACETPRFNNPTLCPVQIVTVGGQHGLRLCRGQSQPGELVRADGPAELSALAVAACEHWAKRRSWDGFAPGTPKGFGGGKKKRGKR